MAESFDDIAHHLLHHRGKLDRVETACDRNPQFICLLSPYNSDGAIGRSDARMREIIPGLLWTGNASDARDVKRVMDNQIGAVVDLAIEELPPLLPRELAYCRLPLVDGQGNSPAVMQAAIDTTTTFVKGRIPTLVSCGGGMSRSPAIAAAVVARVNNLSLEDALKHVAATGPHDITPLLWREISDLVSQRS